MLLICKSSSTDADARMYGNGGKSGRCSKIARRDGSDVSRGNDHHLVTKLTGNVFASSRLAVLIVFRIVGQSINAYIFLTAFSQSI
jgi:hypothetical protein